MITYQIESWSQCLPEMMGLWPAHWAEVAADKEKFAFDPDLDRYAAMESKGALHVVTARRGGELVGYFVWIIGPLLHHRTVLAAMSDAYWLHPSARGGFAGVRFLKEADRLLEPRGVQKKFVTFQPWLDLHRIYERLGWQPAERVFCKTVGN